MRILDAGCGTGEALQWLTEEVGAEALLVGIELAAAHATATRTTVSAQTAVLQADLLKPPFAVRSFDLIWSVNTINHLRDPLTGVKLLATLLRAGVASPWARAHCCRTCTLPGTRASSG